MLYPHSSIFLIDDHKVVLDGLSFMLNKQENFHIVGKASDEDMAVKKISSLQKCPDIIITDFRLEHTTGLDVIKSLKSLDIDFKFIFLTMITDLHIINECWNSGCSAFISKSIEATKLIQIIKDVSGGKRYISQEHLNSLKQIKPNQSLSKREYEILEYILAGFSSKEISNMLFISKRTVDNHRFNILRKYNCKNTIQLLSKYKIEEIAS